jgi:hypothetical protein
MNDRIIQSIRDSIVLIAILLAVLYVHDAEAQEDKRDVAHGLGVAGYVTGAFVGTGIGLVGALKPLYVNGAHATTAAGAHLYYYPPFAGLGTGIVAAIGSAAVVSSSYVITDAVQEKGVKKYHKEVVAYYQDNFDVTMDFYKGLFK